MFNEEMSLAAEELCAFFSLFFSVFFCTYVYQWKSVPSFSHSRRQHGYMYPRSADTLYGSVTPPHYTEVLSISCRQPTPRLEFCFLISLIRWFLRR